MSRHRESMDQFGNYYEEDVEEETTEERFRSAVEESSEEKSPEKSGRNPWWWVPFIVALMILFLWSLHDDARGKTTEEGGSYEIRRPMTLSRGVMCESPELILFPSRKIRP